jgi:hypothetical protein
MRTAKEEEAIRKYMSELGKKGAAKNKKKGSAYFRWVRSHGRQKPKLQIKK